MELTPGKYEATLIEVTVGESDEGKVQFYFGFQIPVEGHAPLRCGKYWTLTDDTAQYIAKDAVTIGFEGDDLSDIAEDGIAAFNTEKKVLVTVEEKEYQDSKGNHKTKLEVSWINELRARMKKPLSSPKKLKGFASLIKTAREEKGEKAKAF